MKMGFVSGGNGKEDAQSRGSGGGIGEIPIIIYYDATYKTKTNADRIRAMSDEELAEFLAEYRCVHKAPHCMETNCKQCWLDWLQQEVTT